MQAKRRIDVLLTEPLQLVRAGLRALLEKDPGLFVVADTGEGNDVIPLVTRLKPDLLILDPSLPGPPAHQLLKQVISACPSLETIVLGDPRDAVPAVRLLEAGAIGCYSKSDSTGEFLRGVQAVARGEFSVSNSMTRWLVHQQSIEGVIIPIESLTEREREILDLLNSGLSNKEIAQGLYLSVRTVEVHLRHIYAKLGVTSRLEAVTRSAPQRSSGSIA